MRVSTREDLETRERRRSPPSCRCRMMLRGMTWEDLFNTNASIVATISVAAAKV